VTFIILCEAFMRIDHHFDLWNHFFRVRRPQDPDAEMTVLGGMIIHVMFGHGIDPYFDILTPKSMKG
jgi:hypothetical protein